MGIHEKLCEIQSKLRVGKSQYNEFGRYYYRNCEDILQAVKPLLEGCTLVITDHIKAIGDRFYVQAVVTISDGESAIEAEGYAREPEERKGMDASMLTGSASSYARKYALSGLFCIDDNKDADDAVEEITADRFEVGIDWFPQNNQPIAKMDAWFKSKSDSFELLDDTDKKKVRSYLKQIKDVMKEDGIDCISLKNE